MVSMPRYRCPCLLVLVGVALVVVSVDCGHDQELDPYDMVRFDHINMKMKEQTEPASSENQAEESTSEQTITSDEKEKGSSLSTEEEAAPEPVLPKQQENPAPSEDLPKGQESPTAAEDRCAVQQQGTDRSCPALSLFQQFVSRLLLFVKDKVSEMDEKSPTEVCVRFSLTSRQLETLESFKRDRSKHRVFSAHEILTQAMQGAHIVSSDDPSLRMIWLEERFGVPVEKAVQILLFLVLALVLVILLSKLRFSWNLLVWVCVFGFLVSIATTWYRLYKGEVAKQHEAMMKDLPQGCIKPSEGAGTLEKLYNFYKHSFTFQQDECIAYYEHLIIDPLVKVSLMEALAVAVVQTLLKPMRTVGTEISEFLRALVKDLPVQWQFFTVITVFIMFTLMLFLSCGYRLRIPFVLAIEPSRHSDTKEEVRALKQQVHELKASVEGIGAVGSTHQPLALPQPTNTVAALPPCFPVKSGGAAERQEDVPTETFSCLPASQTQGSTVRKRTEQRGDLSKAGALTVGTETKPGSQCHQPAQVEVHQSVSQPQLQQSNSVQQEDRDLSLHQASVAAVIPAPIHRMETEGRGGADQADITDHGSVEDMSVGRLCSDSACNNDSVLCSGEVDTVSTVDARSDKEDKRPTISPAVSGISNDGDASVAEIK